MPVQLEQAILDDGVQFVHFFEGRLLTGQDLRDEQQADRNQRRRLGRAVGSGVAEGLQVTLLSPGGAGTSPVVQVQPGWAVNLEGEPLGLCDAKNVELVRAVEEDDGSSQIFHTCADTPPGVQIPNGIGFYVFVIGPASGFQGEAPKSGLTNGGVASGCGKRYATFGVQFRLVKLDPLALSAVDSAIKAQIAGLAAVNTATARSLVRNLMAHVCLGTSQTRSFPADPALLESGESAFLDYGALDDLRELGTLRDCEVPLALLSWTLTGVSFLDMWAVRRRIHRLPVDTSWPLLAADRRRAEAEASAFQFQEQLKSLTGPGSPLIQAQNYFRYLPATGIVQLADASHQGFNAGAFFQGLTTSGPHPLEGARLLPLIDQSYSHRAIDLQAPAPEPKLIWRYNVRENTQAPTGVQRYQVFAVGHLPFQGDPMFELTMLEECAQCQEAIEELQEALAEEQTGTLRVNVRDSTSAVLAGVAVNAEHMATGQVRVAVTNASGQAQFADVPAGAWQVRVALGGFSSATQNTTVPAGGTVTVTLTLGRTTGNFGGIIGSLVDDSGQPLPGEIVQIIDLSGNTQSVLTGPDGSYSFEFVPAGSYRVVAAGQDDIEVSGVQVAVGAKQYVGLGFGGA